MNTIPWYSRDWLVIWWTFYQYRNNNSGGGFHCVRNVYFTFFETNAKQQCYVNRNWHERRRCMRRRSGVWFATMLVATISAVIIFSHLSKPFLIEGMLGSKKPIWGKLIRPRILLRWSYLPFLIWGVLVLFPSPRRGKLKEKLLKLKNLFSESWSERQYYNRELISVLRFGEWKLTAAVLQVVR